VPELLLPRNMRDLSFSRGAFPETALFEEMKDARVYGMPLVWAGMAKRKATPCRKAT
jgi:hypothetical protein